MGGRLRQAGRWLLARAFDLKHILGRIIFRLVALFGRIADLFVKLAQLPFDAISWLMAELGILLPSWMPFRSNRVRQRLETLQQPADFGNGYQNEKPRESIPYPRRPNRFATAIVTVGVIVALGFLTGQLREFDNGETVASAISEEQLATEAPTAVPSNTPTASPTNTATPSPTPTATPSPSPTIEPSPTAEKLASDSPIHDPLRNGGIAFEMRKNGNSDIYVLMVGVEEPIRLTSHQAEDRDPAWSPDGRYLAFSSRRVGNWEIYVLDLLSGDLSRLTNDKAYDGAPSWSPDGLWLVYESYQDENLDLYLIQSDGSGSPTRLTEHPAQDFSPTWSPRGRHIAFTSWRSGNKDIYIMSLNSLSDEDAVNVTASPDAYEDGPVFSPDGNYLAYGDTSDGYEVIYVLELDESDPSGSAQSVGQGRHPSWSPASDSLVYVHQNYDQYYLIASSLDAWNTAPQVYVSDIPLTGSAWTQVGLPAQLGDRLGHAPSVDEPLFIEQVSERADQEPPYLLFELDVEAPSPYLNDRVDQSFSALRQRVIDEVGWDFLGQVDNMYDALAAKPLPGEPAESWNKAGRAFDFYYRYPISVDPQVEIVREDRGNDTYWRVYLRAALQDGSQGEPLRQRSWDYEARYGEDPLYYDQGGKWKEKPPAGYYVDFTALAEDYGWTRVPAAPNWRTYFQGIRYWHFENQQGLSWDEALLEIFTIDEISMVGGYSQ